jgi:opacity protein-like surface antigen
MSKLLWRGFGLAALIAGSAQAADLPSAPPPVVEPIVAAPIVQSWTGFYLGLNAGYGRGRNSIIETGDTVSGPPNGQQAINAGAIPASLAGNPSGVLGGGQVGANWQMSQFVIGFEAGRFVLGHQVRLGRRRRRRMEVRAELVVEGRIPLLRSGKHFPDAHRPAVSPPAPSSPRASISRAASRASA